MSAPIAMDGDRADIKWGSTIRRGTTYGNVPTISSRLFPLFLLLSQCLCLLPEVLKMCQRGKGFIMELSWSCPNMMKHSQEKLAVVEQSVPNLKSVHESEF